MLLDTILAAAGHTSGRLVPGLALGIAAAAGLAVLTARTRAGLTWLAVVPELLMVTAWFSPAVALVALCVAVPVHVLTHGALRTQDAALTEAVGTLPLTRRQVYRHVVLPSAVPRLFLGLRVGTLTAVAGLLVVEVLGTADTLVLAAVVVLGGVLLLAVHRVERRLVVWR